MHDSVTGARKTNKQQIDDEEEEVWMILNDPSKIIMIISLAPYLRSKYLTETINRMTSILFSNFSKKK